MIQGIYREACQAIKSSLTERTRVASSTLFAKAGFLRRLVQGHSYFFFTQTTFVGNEEERIFHPR